MVSRKWERMSQQVGECEQKVGEVEQKWEKGQKVMKILSIIL